jgi:hypothetical protein
LPQERVCPLILYSYFSPGTVRAIFIADCWIRRHSLP